MEAIHDCPISNHLAAASLNPEERNCREIIGNKTETRIFATAAWGERHRGQVPYVGVDAGPGSPIPATTAHLLLMSDCPAIAWA